MRGFFKALRWSVLPALLIGQPLPAGQAYLQHSCDMPFPEAMSLLQEAIGSRGYTVSRVQYVDKGLRESGYQTGLYRVVFFGRPEQMAMVRERYPALIPYLPLKITLYEGQHAVGASTLQPATLAPYFSQPPVRRMIDGWQRDVVAIMANYGHCDGD